MAEKTPLASNSSQFAYLEYFLQLCSHASTARIISAHAISNPHVTVQFEKKCENILTLDAWVDPSTLPSNNSEEEVLRRGFNFSKDCLNVKVGIEVASKTTHRAILCKIGVGRAYPVDEAVGHDFVPEDYDSFYCVPDASNDEYYHAYIISNAAQILPMYIIQYEYDPAKEKRSREKPKCENCEIAYADFYCASDSANLCKKCDLELHSANKLVSRHIRTPIGEGADVFGNCRFHTDKLVEFFCSQCHVPVCVHCKMVGHHSAGEAAKHKLVSVIEAYQTVAGEAQIPDSILSSRKQAIDTQITSIDTRAKQVEKHVSSIQAQIEDIYKRALQELENITKRKMDVLRGDKCELQRQLGEIFRMEEFLQYQQGGDATQFLFSWARHQQSRQELHDFRFFRDHIDVQLDIKCSGSISVLVEPSSAADARTSPARRQMSSIKSRSPTGLMDDTRSVLTTSGNSPTRSGSPRQNNAQPTLPGGSFAGGMVSSNKLPSRGASQSRPKASGGPKDFFSEALGALDEISIAGNHGSGDFTTDFSLAEGEGYISD